MLLRDFVVFYAKAFCGNSVERAKARLEKNHEKRLYDMKIQYFSLGVIFVCLMKLVQIFCTSHEVAVWQQLGSSIYIFYFTGILTYILLAVSFCIYVFKCYSINYLVIFEVD